MMAPATTLRRRKISCSMNGFLMRTWLRTARRAPSEAVMQFVEDAAHERPGERTRHGGQPAGRRSHGVARPAVDDPEREVVEEEGSEHDASLVPDRVGANPEVEV